MSTPTREAADGMRQEPQAAPAQAAEAQARPLYAIEAHPEAPRDPLVVRAAYRAFEFFAALCGIIVTSPVLLAVAILIKLDSPGPVLFLQQRFSRSRLMRGSELTGRRDIVSPTGQFEPDKLYWVPTMFTFVKFRSMYVDAHKRFPEYSRLDFKTHEEFRAGFYKTENDPRVTPVGKWLRRLTLDELPNFWNILTGKIGLVGPRPEVPSYVWHYSAEEMIKFSVRPGITGLAVINGRGTISIGGQIDWDLVYVRDRCVKLDLKVLVITAWLVLVRRGAF